MGKLKIPEIILIQETINKFGYDPRLFKGTKDYIKQVVCTCFCGKILEQPFATVKIRFKNNTKCKYCANKERSIANAEKKSIRMKEGYASGKYIHPMKGKNHTQEAKDKLSKFHKGLSLENKIGKERADKQKKEASERFSGSGNPFFGKKHTLESIEKNKNKSYSDEQRKSIGDFRRGKTFEELYGIDKSIELKTKASKRFSGSGNPAFGKIYNCKKGYLKQEYKNYYFRSSWELKVAKYFDENKINWLFETTIFDLKNGTTYRPDFYLIDEDKWIEVKGYWYEDAKEKFEKFKEIYPEIKIEIWDKYKMKNLKLI